jgi:TonB family protein
MKHLGIACGLLICVGLCGAGAGAQAQLPANATAAGATVATTPSVPVAAANPQTPEEFFARARQLSDLEAAGIPFHLKATYVASGDAEFTGNGTYEEWWQSKDVWRKEATLGDYKYVEIENGDKLSAYETSSYVPLRLRQAMRAVLIRIPADAGASGGWKMQHKKLNGVDLTVLSNKNICDPGHSKVECVTQDYFTADGVFRIHVVDAVEDLFNGLQPFQNLLISRDVTEAVNGTVILTISVTSLEPLSAGTEKILSTNTPPPANLQPITFPQHVDTKVDTQKNDVKAAKVLNATQPVYPTEARNQGIYGTVVIDAIIDETGKIREPFVIHSAGTLLDKAALDAVRRWHYRPTTLNGLPVGVDTTISVVFTLNH